MLYIVRSASIAVVALAIGCGEPAPHAAASPPAPTPDPPPYVAATPLPPPEIPADRRCGEPGATPTDLPPAVDRGRTAIGSAKLRAGDSIAFGTVSVKWDASAWIGNRGTGHRGDALVVRIDQAEANGGAYGATEEIIAARKTALHVGPYRFDVRMSAEPIEVAVEVTKNACPENGVIENATLPLSAWVSTEATRFRTFDSSSAMLQIGVANHFAAPRLDVSTLGWRQWFEPIPDAPLRLLAGRYVVTIDEIVRGDLERVHVRALVEAAPPPSTITRTPGSGCGAPSSTATTLPPALDEIPRVIEEQHLDVDNDAISGAIVMHARRDPTGEYLMVRFDAEPSPSPSMVSFAGVDAGGQLVRAGTALLRVDPSGVDEVQVRRLVLGCPADVRIDAIDAPTHVWLSTIGHALVQVGPPTAPALTIRLHATLTDPSIGVSTPHAYWSPTVKPAVVGDAFTLDGVLVEILDVTSSGGTAFDARWTTPNTVPAVHVQLRLSPAQ